MLIAIPTFGAFLLPLPTKISKKIRDAWSVFITFLTLCLAILLLANFKIQGSLQISYPWIKTFGIDFSILIDGLSIFFVLIIASLGFLTSIYSVAYISHEKGGLRYQFLFLLFLAGMLGVAISSNLIGFYLFFELMSLSSAFLVAFHSERKEAVKAAIKYFLMAHIGGMCILLGIIFTFCLYGTFDMTVLASTSLTSKYRLLISILFLIGFGIKAAMVPLHTWLPDAHPEAPCPISALLSGVMIKVGGIYAILRIIYCVYGFNTLAITTTVAYLGAITAVVGVTLAILQTDFKRLLAYHSISQIGYILMGIGIGTSLGITGGLFHVLNHAMFKGLLFLCAGAVLFSTGTRDLEKLGGLSRNMPLTATTCFVAAFSISGVPPFNGFASKWLIYEAGLEAGHPELTVIALIVSVFTLASFLKVLYGVFFGIRPIELEDTKEVPLSMKAPMIVLAAGCIFSGIFSSLILKNLVIPATSVIIPTEIHFTNIIFTTYGFWSPSLTTALLLLGLFIGLIFYLIGRRIETISGSAGLPFTCGESMPMPQIRVSAHSLYYEVKTSYAHFFGSESTIGKNVSLMFDSISKKALPKIAKDEWQCSGLDRLYYLIAIIYLGLGERFRKIHTGVLSRYANWIIFMLIILLVVFLVFKIYTVGGI